MKEFLSQSAYFSIVISLSSYGFGSYLRNKLRSPIFNPLLISIVLTIPVLLLLDVDYKSYERASSFLSWLLTPATAALAVPLYEQFELLKKNTAAVIAGVISGVLASLGSVLGLAVLFGFSHEEYVTFLPKSITTAIGIGVSEENGGIIPITVGVIVITGVIGNMLGEPLMKLLRITDPIAKGVALGSSAHVMGTSRAMEIGKVEGAMSSLSVVVSGIITVAAAALFSNFY